MKKLILAVLVTLLAVYCGFQYCSMHRAHMRLHYEIGMQSMVYTGSRIGATVANLRTNGIAITANNFHERYRMVFVGADRTIFETNRNGDFEISEQGYLEPAKRKGPLWLVSKDKPDVRLVRGGPEGTVSMFSGVNFAIPLSDSNFPTGLDDLKTNLLSFSDRGWEDVEMGLEATSRRCKDAKERIEKVGGAEKILNEANQMFARFTPEGKNGRRKISASELGDYPTISALGQVEALETGFRAPYIQISVGGPGDPQRYELKIYSTNGHCHSVSGSEDELVKSCIFAGY